MNADSTTGSAYTPALVATLTAGWFYRTLIIVLSVWILQSFLLALLIACVTVIASWPLYERFTDRLPRCMTRTAASLIFTSVITVFVLAPLTFAFGALLTESHALLLEIAAADKNGIAVPHWLEKLPLAGSWLAAWWQSELAHPGGLLLWAQRADPAALLSWAQSLGNFMGRQVFIIGFTILALYFLYQQGESLAKDLRQVLRARIGREAEASLDLATRALRGSVNSMLVVALFDGIATGLAYAVAGVPHPAMWGAITGALALVPFLGYVAVAMLTAQLTMSGAATPALLSFLLGCVILFCGDKILRPALVRDGTHLRFVWVVMGCLGGFELLGLMGVVIGPVVLTLGRELWEQRVRDAAAADVTAEESRTRHRGVPRSCTVGRLPTVSE